jgi:hypothetical protein
VLRADRGYAGYRWSTGATADSLVVSRSGTYFVLVTDESGCSGRSDTIEIIVDALPTPVVTAQGPTTFCAGESVALTVDPSYASYRWSTGETTPAITVRAAGAYTVTVTTPAGCAGTSAPLTVVVRPLLPPRIAGPSSVCPSREAAYRVFDDTTGAFTYAWQVQNGTVLAGADAPRLTVRWDAAGTGRLVVIKRETSSGCEAADTMTVTVGSELTPLVQALPRARICEGDSVTLQAEDGYDSYVWSRNGTAIPDANRRSIAVRQPGSYAVTVADTAGCSGTSDPVEITVSALPAPVISALGPVAFCLGDSVRLETNIPAAVYRWERDGVPITGGSTRRITVRAAGEYSVEVTDENGCTARSAALIVEVTPLREPLIEGPPAVCAGETAAYRTPPVAGSVYQWSVIGPAVIESGASADNCAVRFTATGSVTLRCEQTDTRTGCRAEAAWIVEVQDELTPYITIDGRTRLCAGETAVLRAPAGYASYAWSTGAQTDSIVVSAPGSYTVTVRSQGGCTGTSPPVVVTMHPAPAPVVTTRDATAFCAGDSARLEADAGYVTYQWWKGATEPVGSGRAITVREGGRYTVVVTNDGGCEGISPPMEITVFPAVAPVITVADRLLTAQPPAAEYHWYRDGVPLPGANAQSIEAEESGSYRVFIRDRHGCTAVSDPVDVTVRIASAAVALPVITARPGERILIPVLLTASEGLDAAGASRFSGALVFDRALLHPDGAFTDDQGLRSVLFAGSWAPAMGTADAVLAEIPATVLLGAADRTPLALTAFAFEGADVDVAATAGELRVEICRAGGDRYFLATGSAELRPNRPNPFNASTLFEYELIEDGWTELFITDALGRRVATVSAAEQKPGRYLVPFSAGALPSGTYHAVLRTPSDLRSILIAIVK